MKKRMSTISLLIVVFLSININANAVSTFRNDEKITEISNAITQYTQSISQEEKDTFGINDNTNKAVLEMYTFPWINCDLETNGNMKDIIDSATVDDTPRYSVLHDNVLFELINQNNEYNEYIVSSVAENGNEVNLMYNELKTKFNNNSTASVYYLPMIYPAL